MIARRDNLSAYALFAAVLAAAGLPIYINAPKFYAENYGVGLAAMGAVLFVLRLIDVVQDPALGWLGGRLAERRGPAVAIAGGLMALGMVGLFAVAPPVAPLLWFAVTLTVLFSAFSFLTVCFYAQGVRTAARLEGDGHVRVATWRETGSLLGISVAAVLPALLAPTGAAFAIFAAVFTLATLAAVYAMRREWHAAGVPQTPRFGAILGDPLARRLLVIAFLNASPVAVTSTLFLFFVDSRLEAPVWTEGPLLLLFFLAAAASAPVWGRIAQAIGARRALMAGMALAIVSFAGAAALGAGDVAVFAVICLASGAALGADMTLLPAIFAARMSEIVPEAAEGFGLWSFVSKLTLAVAAAVLLPLLQAAGYQTGASVQPEAALSMLTLTYAVLPCGLKLAALALLAATPLGEAGATAMEREV